MSKLIVYDIFYVFRACKEYAETIRRIKEVYGITFTTSQIKSILKNPLYRGRPRDSKKHPEIVVHDARIRIETIRVLIFNISHSP